MPANTLLTLLPLLAPQAPGASQDVQLATAVAAPPAAQVEAPEARPGEGWTQWRGPNRDGTVAGEAWPQELSERTLTRAWSAEGLGASYATPLVTATHVYTVGTLDETYEVVRAYDRATGEEAWRSQWEGSMKVPFFAAKNGSWVRSTPAFDGERLYVGGMRDVLVCLDGQTGEEVWRVDFAQRHGVDRPSFGLVCSPLVDGDALYLQAGAALEKLDKRTGETLWRTMEGESAGMNSAFSSPILAEVAGETQLVVQSRQAMAGLDPASGEVRWSHPIKAFRGMNILTPQPYAGGFFTGAYGGRCQWLSVTKGEQGFEVESAWTHRGQGYMTSPVVIDDHAYLFLRSNRFACIPLDDGDGGYISEPTGDEYMSLIAQGDRLLALANTGVLRLVRANPEAFEVLGEVDLVDGKSWAHLAVCGNQLFVREEHSLHAFTWGEAPSVQ